MTLKLNIYKKSSLTTPIATGDGALGVAITGLSAGTVVAAGDYKVSHTDSEGKLLESDKVDVPAFTVIPAKVKATAPTGVTATPTADGATIKSA